MVLEWYAGRLVVYRKDTHGKISEHDGIRLTHAQEILDLQPDNGVYGIYTPDSIKVEKQPKRKR